MYKLCITLKFHTKNDVKGSQHIKINLSTCKKKILCCGLIDNNNFTFKIKKKRKKEEEDKRAMARTTD